MSALMLGTSFTMLFQGTIPTGVDTNVLRAYSFFLSTSLLLLFVSLWSALQLQGRMSSWMNRYELRAVAGCPGNSLNPVSSEFDLVVFPAGGLLWSDT